MSVVDKWRKWFMGQYGDVRNAFVEHEESSTHLISVLLSSYLKSASAGGIYIDIGLGNKSGEITAVGATFYKGFGGVYVSNNLIIFDHDVVKRAGKITFAGAEKRLSESAEGYIEYEIKNDVFRLTDLNASLLFWNGVSKNYVPVMQWGMDAYKSSEFEVLCNACFGEGESKHMSIPKADLESGLTGYALYSTNRINGTYGCKACGGGGANYEEWYLKENPNLRDNSEPFRKGWGTFPQSNVTEVEIHVPY